MLKQLETERERDREIAKEMGRYTPYVKKNKSEKAKPKLSQTATLFN